MDLITLLLFCVILVTLAVIISFRKDSKASNNSRDDCGQSTIPGPPVHDTEKGNLVEIGEAGSLHQYLMGQHKRHGSVVGFWFGKQYVVSVASPTSFRTILPVFERPPELFQLFEVFITPKSIQYANFEDGRRRRRVYDQAFSHAAMANYYAAFQQVTDELVAEWSKANPTDHLPLHNTLIDLAIETIALVAFGEYFQDTKLLNKFQDSYDICWEIMEHSLANGFPAEDSEEFDRFISARDCMYEMVKEIIAKRKMDRDLAKDKILFDYLLELDDDEERIFADSLSYIIGGFHTTGNMLTWALYYLARDQSIQDKLAEEIISTLGNANVDATNIGKLTYLRQVQEETLRTSVLAPWGAKFAGNDVTLDGFTIPAKTPIITALGVMLQDETYWPNPTRFDPDRFSAENCSKRSPHTFSPFGVAGKRICPGYRFAYSETAVVIATLVRKFHLKLCNVGDVKQVFGLVTHPSEEIWISVTPRQ